MEKKCTESLQERLVRLLKERGLRICFAESCTGGLAAAGLVSVPDASCVLDVSFVTYANEAKIEYLGVSLEDIRQYGVVSEQVARQMAVGAAKRSRAQVGVGITGIAGPGGGTQEKPVGTVCFGFFIKKETSVFTKSFGNLGRNAVREESVRFVYEKLLELLEAETKE